MADKGSNYFTNPKKDDKPRRGRPPGSKNKKTIEAEKKAEKMRKQRMKKNPVAMAGAVAGELARAGAEKVEDKVGKAKYFDEYSIDEKKEIWGAMKEYVKSMYSQQDLEDAKDRADEEEIDLNEMFKDMGFDGSPVDIATGYALTWDSSYWDIDVEKACGGKKNVDKSKVHKSWTSNAVQIVSQAYYDIKGIKFGCPDADIKEKLEDVVRKLETLNTDLHDMEYNEKQGWDVGKSVSFKGHAGHFIPIAKSGHYTMWQSVEYGDKAYNIITKTMKQKNTGKLVEKIHAEQVDGFSDEKAKMFKSKQIKE